MLRLSLHSHLALLGSHGLALLGASGAFPVAGGESLVGLRETSVGTALHVGLVGVVELLLLASHGVVLAHVHLLLTLCHFAVLLFIARQLIGVDHRKHLREALTNARNSLRRITEG